MMLLKKTAASLMIVALFVSPFGLVGCGPEGLNNASAWASRDPLAPASLQIPEIQAALKTKEEIEMRRVTLCSYNAKLDGVITETMDAIPGLGFGTSDPDSFLVTATIENLIESTRKLRVMVREILAQKDKYLAVLREFEKPVSRAPAELRRAAELFKQFSEEEEYEALREDYVVMSQMFLGLASRFESQREQFEQEFNEAEYLEMMAYLERGALMLDRFEAALEVARSSSQLAEAEYYLQNLRTFIRAFEDFRGQIRRVNNMLDESEPAESPNPRREA